MDEFEIIRDYEIRLPTSEVVCRHCRTASPIKAICPAVVKVVTEGGFSCTIVCVQCVIEAAAQP